MHIHIDERLTLCDDEWGVEQVVAHQLGRETTQQAGGGGAVEEDGAIPHAVDQGHSGGPGHRGDPQHLDGDRGGEEPRGSTRNTHLHRITWRCR